MNLTVIIATRCRPDQLKATLERTLPNMVRLDTTLLVLIDEDDEATLKVLGSLPTECRYSIKPREDSRGLKYERAWTEAPAGCYLVGHDCAPILTHGFDEIVVGAASRFPDGIGCIYGPPANGSFPQFQAPTAKMVELMGYIYHPAFPFWFIDHWLDDICRMTERYWMVPVYLDHNATRPGITYNLRELVFWSKYYDVLINERREQADGIIAAMNEPAWRKDALRANYMMTEVRSFMINELGVRGPDGKTAEFIEATRGDPNPPTEQYLRARQRAAEHFR